MNTGLSTLQHLGFRRVGSWQVDGERLSYELNDAEDAEGVLYAFVSDEVVLYVGKTTQPLRKRMYGYQRPGPTQRTNIRCHGLLTELIRNEKAVAIHVLLDDGSYEYRGIPLSLAGGLEDSLIARLMPPWNLQGR